MKKILAYITPEKHAGFFDLVIAYDSDVDAIVPYSKIEISDVKDVIYGAVFTRHPKDLKNTAIFIGGHDFNKAQELMDEVLKVFEKLPENLRVSVAFDPDGASTTAASCIAKIKSSLGEISGKKVVVLAGTGPVGQSASVFLTREGCKVSITSRKLEKAKEVVGELKKRYDIDVEPLQGSNPQEIENAVSNAEIVISTGAEGVQLLPKNIWSKFSGIKVMADVNAVPPAGIEGINPKDDKVEREGKICFGAIGIGSLKIKVHHELIKRLFQSPQEVFDLGKIYELTLNEINKK
jgi:hypothetical protein